MEETASASADNGAPEISERKYPTNLKLLMIGPSAVGKSSLLLRFTDDDFLTVSNRALQLLGQPLSSA